MKSFSVLAAMGIVVTAGAVGGTLASRAPAVAATPPPTPPPIGTPASPSPNATLIPLGGATPRPSPSPPSSARKGLDGVWEVQLQHADTTDYTHFNLAQDGSQLTGTYLDKRGKKYPLSGSIDGQAVRLIVTMPDGTTLLLQGKLDGTSDMIGMLTTAGSEVPFTASYRPKEKWIENINPSPGGVPSSGGYTPP